MNHQKKVPILLVDDRQQNLTSLAVLLDDMNLELVQARSGNEALRQALYKNFALVLMDVMMPEMDGFETAELMHLNPKTCNVPIIFLTAGMKEDFQRFKGYESGAVDYLVKPIEPTILRSKVRVFSKLFLQRLELERTQAELKVRNGELHDNQVKLEEQNRKLIETFRKLEQETAQRLRAMEELRQKEQMLLHQSRLAAMGEMIGNIAHQWRQPLNALGIAIQQLLLFYDIGEFDRKLLEENVETSMGLIKHMSVTIDDFRNYFKPDKEKADFRLSDVITKTLALIEDSFKNQRIEIDVKTEDDPVIYGYHNEFAQALLNILNNARDALMKQGADEPVVTIRSAGENGKAVLTIADNAGGIPDEIMGKIFDPYFTTKGPQQGTGIGLYMSKVIIEKNMGGILSARNTPTGAEFRIEV